MQYSNKAYLLIGGNVGDRLAYLSQARALLTLHSGAVIKTSRIYETAAWGITEQANFLNQALILSTSLTAPELIIQLLAAEQEIGRERGEKFGPRIIDIDILLFNEEIHNLPNLSIPHPQLAGRRFALQPLADIAAEIIHPVLMKSVADLLAECPDHLKVSIFEAAADPFR